MSPPFDVGPWSIVVIGGRATHPAARLEFLNVREDQIPGEGVESAFMCDDCGLRLTRFTV